MGPLFVVKCRECFRTTIVEMEGTPVPSTSYIAAQQTLAILLKSLPLYSSSPEDPLVDRPCNSCAWLKLAEALEWPRTL